jgi:hypothetical protein
MTSTPKVVAQLAGNVAALRDTGVSFLISDVELALTMLQRAADARDPEARARNVRYATHAYQTVQRLSGKLQLDEKQQRAIDSLLETLKAALSELESPPAN